MSIRKLFIVLPLLITIAVSCDKNSSSPTGPDENNAYVASNVIAFNDVQHVLGENYALALINPDSKEIIKLGPNMTTASYSWSDDATRLVMSDFNTPDPENRLSEYQICVIYADGSKIYKYDAYGISPILSPDNKKIAFLQSNENIGSINSRNLYIYEIQNSEITLLKENIESIVDWSDNGENIIYYTQLYNYSSRNDEERTYYSIDYKSKEVESITYPVLSYDPDDDGELNNFYNAILSPDGSKWLHSNMKVAFDPITFKIQYMTSLYTVNYNGTGEKILFEKEELVFMSYSWAPDSKRITYTDGASLNVIDSDGSNQEVLIEFEPYSMENPLPTLFIPTWSPR